MGAPLEIERKYLIEYPDIAWLESLENCCKVEIVQTYLHRHAGDEIRIRKRGIDGHYVYYKTIKRDITGLKRVEMEERLSYEEYLDLLMEADTTKEQIEKLIATVGQDH